MRVGTNPQKILNEKNLLKKHRIIIVFYNPVSNDKFFNQLDNVLDKCLDSVIKTVNFDLTQLTVINNNSSESANAVINKYRDYIDKYVIYNENKGKVYAVLNEVRSVYEEFVTIADSDILFFDGWEEAVFNVFKNHPRAGTVSPYPSPYTTFYVNKSTFGLNAFKRNIKYGKFVADKDIEFYLKGTDLPNLVDRKFFSSWKEKQYISKADVCAVIGAYHVVATYRSLQFKNIDTYPELKFVNSYEEKFIDCLADNCGMMRLSTIKTYIYHIGNKMDDIANTHVNTGKDKLNSTVFDEILPWVKENKIKIFLYRTVGKLMIEMKWNRTS